MTTKNLRLTCFRLAEVSPHITESRPDATLVELVECNTESIFKHFTDEELVDELNRRHRKEREVKAALSTGPSIFFEPIMERNEDL